MSLVVVAGAVPALLIAEAHAHGVLVFDHAPLAVAERLAIATDARMIPSGQAAAVASIAHTSRCAVVRTRDPSRKLLIVVG